MTDATTALDEAFDRMARLDFELPNGFVNHGPMACEALAALDLDDQIEGWARRFVRIVGTGPKAERPQGIESGGWRSALGDYSRLPEWLGYFDERVDDEGWAPVVRTWVPRLVPGLSTALFHGIIRTAQGVRAIAAVDTEARRAELARSLAYWAARFRPGQPTTAVKVTGEAGDAVVGDAARGARHYVAEPNIYNLHGVTGAMAVELLLPHITEDDGLAALAQVRAEHAAMYGDDDLSMADHPNQTWDEHVAMAAADSHDVHAVKLVEACHRGFVSTSDPSFTAAAGRVARRR
jgi:hypothetical protein